MKVFSKQMGKRDKGGLKQYEEELEVSNPENKLDSHDFLHGIWTL